VTTNYLGPCSIDGCSRQAVRCTDWGNLCETHRKRVARVGDGSTLSEPVQERDPRKRVIEVALAYADAESEKEFARAAADLEAVSVELAELKRAHKRLIAAGAAAGEDVLREGERRLRRRLNDAIKRGMAAARAGGARLGRPPRLDREAAVHAVRAAGDNVRKAAKMLGVDEAVVRRALVRGYGGKLGISPHGSMHAWSPPAPPDSDPEKP
jgi:hypothetical protein